METPIDDAKVSASEGKDRVLTAIAVPEKKTKRPVDEQHGYSDIPSAFWTRSFKDEFPPNQEFKVSVGEALSLLGLAYRIWRYGKVEREAGRLPVIDPFDGSFKAVPDKGVPLGGIGGGSINRGWRGEFSRFQLQPGYAVMDSVPVNAFSVYISPKTSEVNGEAKASLSPSGETSLSLSSSSNSSGKSSPRNSGRLNLSRSGEKAKMKEKKPNACVLTPRKSAPKDLKSWNFGIDGSQSNYYALFPRAWTVYQEPDPEIVLTCRQVSPVIPHNYKESSYPVSVFVWNIDNRRDEAATVSLMFTFQNGTGEESDRKGGHVNTPFKRVLEKSKVVGVNLHYNQPVRRKVEEPGKKPKDLEFNDPMSFGIGVLQPDQDTKITFTTKFVTNDSRSTNLLWRQFEGKGMVDNNSDDTPSNEGEAIGAAVVATVTIPAKSSKQIVFALAWDFPITRFGSGRGFYKRYTKFYGKDGNAVEKIICDALQNYSDWEKQIIAWQQPILDDKDLPPFYKAALFNELYYITDGGTIWTNGEVPSLDLSLSGDVFTSEDDSEYGHFGYLEGLEYLMYNTYDVHFYASFALAMLWPQIELSIQRDFATATSVEYEEEWVVLHSGKSARRKLRGSVPHDLGNPGDDPWKKINSYNIQDTTAWKDLNSKFVLQIYRDYVITKDYKFLEDMWPVVKEAIEYMYKFDIDDDGIVDNGGFPDQTYDAWTVQPGCSAYCGGLWIAALEAAATMAEKLGKGDEAQTFTTNYKKAQASYESKLWNGRYYNYDTKSNSIQADMMAGHWYARACDLPPVVPLENAQSALSTIYEYNVMGFQKGALGAINGMKPDGKPDATCLQSLEVWTGTTFGLAAAMIQEGLFEQAWKTAEGVIRSTYDVYGYQFQTPEAWDSKGRYRSFAYMRPLSIWAIQWAWEKTKQKMDAIPVVVVPPEATPSVKNTVEEAKTTKKKEKKEKSRDKRLDLSASGEQPEKSKKKEKKSEKSEQSEDGGLKPKDKKSKRRSRVIPDDVVQATLAAASEADKIAVPETKKSHRKKESVSIKEPNGEIVSSPAEQQK